jgi:hypothetical protein
MGKPFGVYHELLLDRHLGLPSAGIRGATAQAVCSGAKSEATGIAKTRHVGMTIGLPQEGEEQRPGVTVKGRTCRGACY